LPAAARKYKMVRYMHENVLIGLASIIVLGIGAQWLAWVLRLPSILLLLAAGLIAGPATGFLDPDGLLGDLLLPIVSLSVAVILFEGGLNLKISELRQSGSIVRNLVTLGTLVTWVIGTLAAYLIFDLDIKLAVLLGAILVVTGPTVIMPMLRYLRPSGRVGPILKWEGIVIDPIGAVLAVLVFEAVFASGFDAAAIDLLRTILFGGGAGLLGALLLMQVLKRYWLPDFLHGVFALALAMALIVLPTSCRLNPA
jgi:NhaP-type Na+/H+ or K+/H+ antiporter